MSKTPRTNLRFVMCLPSAADAMCQTSTIISYPMSVCGSVNAREASSDMPIPMGSPDGLGHLREWSRRVESRDNSRLEK